MVFHPWRGHSSPQISDFSRSPQQTFCTPTSCRTEGMPSVESSCVDLLNGSVVGAGLLFRGNGVLCGSQHSRQSPCTRDLVLV